MSQKVRGGRLERTAFWAAVAAQAPGVLAVAQTVSDPSFTRLIWALFGGTVGTALLARKVRWLSAFLKMAFSLLVVLIVRGNYAHWRMVAGEPEVFIAIMLVLLAMILVGGASSLPEALMGVVPHLSVFGLIGTSNINAVIVADFLAFSLLGTFSVSAHLAESLGMGGEEEGRRAVADLTILSGTAVGICVIMGAFVAVLATPSAPKAYSLPATSFLPFVAKGGRFYDFLILGLGNPMSEKEVLEVKAPSEGLLRVAVYDRYQGTHWATRPRVPKMVLPGREGRFVLAPGLLSSPNLRRVEVTVRAGRVDFVACPGRPVVVMAPVEAVWRDIGGTAKFAWPLPVGTKYTVLYVPDVTLPWEDPPRDPFYSRPPTGLFRLVRLAESVAKDGPPLEKAKRIERFLKTKYAYSYGSIPLVQGWDPVEYFLLRSRQGACDLFASAFVLMCRAVGIPARVVAGFRLEEWDPKKRAFIVREKHSHAWAEAWIPGRGWVTFDPTPPAPEELTKAPFDLLRYWGWLRTGNRPFYIVALLSLLAMGYAFLSRREKPSPRPKGVSAVYLSACKRLERVGLKRSPHETPWEFLLRARDRLPPDGFEAFYRLTLLLMTTVYGGREVSEAEAREHLRRLKGSLKRGRSHGKTA